MSQFASRVGSGEFIELMKTADIKDWNLRIALDNYDGTGIFYSGQGINNPNIFCDGNIYELTDEGICYHWPFRCGDDGGGWQINEGSSIICQDVVRMFYLKKFGQEYLDYLFGPNVVSLNAELLRSDEDKNCTR